MSRMKCKFGAQCGLDDCPFDFTDNGKERECEHFISNDENKNVFTVDSVVDVSFSVDNGKIKLKSTQIINGFTLGVTERILDTEEKVIYEALIKLGWTPPNKPIK